MTQCKICKREIYKVPGDDDDVCGIFLENWNYYCSICSEELIGIFFSNIPSKAELIYSTITLEQSSPNVANWIKDIIKAI